MSDRDSEDNGSRKCAIFKFDMTTKTYIYWNTYRNLDQTRLSYEI